MPSSLRGRSNKWAEWLFSLSRRLPEVTGARGGGVGVVCPPPPPLVLYIIIASPFLCLVEGSYTRSICLLKGWHHARQAQMESPSPSMGGQWEMEIKVKGVHPAPFSPHKRCLSEGWGGGGGRGRQVKGRRKHVPGDVSASPSSSAGLSITEAIETR